jgi:hypothetical protein
MASITMNPGCPGRAVGWLGGGRDGRAPWPQISRPPPERRPAPWAAGGGAVNPRAPLHHPPARTELPESLKALFRPVSMVLPDLALICEIMLMAEGFQSSKLLSRKFIILYKLCEVRGGGGGGVGRGRGRPPRLAAPGARRTVRRQLPPPAAPPPALPCPQAHLRADLSPPAPIPTPQDLLSKSKHYDWKLRAIKTTLYVAGGMKRSARELTEDKVRVAGQAWGPGGQGRELRLDLRISPTAWTARPPRQSGLAPPLLPLYHLEIPPHRPPKPLPQVLLRALRDFNLGKLTSDDTSIFMGLLNDLFPKTLELVPRAREVAFETKARRGGGALGCTGGRVRAEPWARL